ncbi:MAG: hypothetical protein EBY66_00560 [Candidatus Fonsibacter lacus]|nr:hypothetical protein [Candidatus Fonsibacter lacus]
MTNQHPITPPPELVQQWWEQADQYQDDPKTYFDYVATEAAQWGADQELEACCEWLRSKDILEPAIDALRADRRPKSPSLKKQALADFDWLVGRTLGRPEFDERSERIRRALEQLDD